LLPGLTSTDEQAFIAEWNNQLDNAFDTAFWRRFVTRPCDPDPDLCENNIPYTGTFDWFAANGNEISGTFEGYLCPTETPGVYDNHETAEVTGGAGRFANATRHFELAGQLDFTTNPPSFVLPWQGVISSVGSTRH